MRETVYALVDCNNFYCSCERVFDASIQTRPVLVLSNNDGCVIARSNQVKKFGIKMGQPAFTCRELIEQHHIKVFSSNFSLYADMSARVMKVLEEFSPCLEVYSIDEAFLDVTQVPREEGTVFGRKVKETVLLQYTGIPVSVGIATSKTLCKVATELVKKHPEYRGVLDLTKLTHAEVDTLLERIPIGDVWGIGPRYGSLLKKRGIENAKALKEADTRWIRKHLTVVGERTVLELRGISCIPLETEREPKKGILSSKSFGKEVKRLGDLEEAVATYTARCAEKLRSQGSLAASITVFIQSSAFKKDVPFSSHSSTRSIPYPTAYTPDLIKLALEEVRAMYKQGVAYHKAGVFLTKIVPAELLQPDLFGDFDLEKQSRQARLMCLVDALTVIFGRDTLFLPLRAWRGRGR